MNDIKKGCMVAPPNPCNYATIENRNATSIATSSATLDLQALSASVLAKSKSNHHCNSRATDQLHNQKKLKELIAQVSQKYGGDDPVFLAAYISDVLDKWAHDLDKVIKCFNSLL